MRSRSVLVVLSLLALAVAPAEASKRRGSTKRNNSRKARIQQAAAAKKKAPRPDNAHASGHLPRKPAETGGNGKPVVKKSAAVVATATKDTTGAKSPRTQSRSVAAGSQRRRGAAVPTTAPARSFDGSAAVAPRKTGRVRRFFAGLAIATVLGLGAVGWQAADMNSKVGDAWTFVQDRIEQVWNQGGNGGGGGGGGNTPIPDPNPIPDPGPEIPDPIPDPGPEPSPEPSPDDGKGNPKPTPQPETP